MSTRPISPLPKAPRLKRRQPTTQRSIDPHSPASLHTICTYITSLSSPSRASSAKERPHKRSTTTIPSLPKAAPTSSLVFPGLKHRYYLRGGRDPESNHFFVPPTGVKVYLDALRAQMYEWKLIDFQQDPSPTFPSTPSQRVASQQPQ